MASRNDHTQARHSLWRVSALVLCLCCLSCSPDMEKVNFFARQEMPHQRLDSATVVRSTEGRLQMVMEAPVVVVYKQPENKTECPQGVLLRFYNGRQVKTSIRANYGISYDDRQYMELKKNVVIIDYQTGDTSYLHDLYWDGIEHRIYSHRPVRSVNGQRVTIGDAFESDEDFIAPVIVRQRGTILLNED